MMIFIIKICSLFARSSKQLVGCQLIQCFFCSLVDVVIICLLFFILVVLLTMLLLVALSVCVFRFDLSLRQAGSSSTLAAHLFACLLVVAAGGMRA